MDIQRGDQVYYRGEVWTVINPGHVNDPWRVLYLRRHRPNGVPEDVSAYVTSVQRVEQVR